MRAKPVRVQRVSLEHVSTDRLPPAVARDFRHLIRLAARRYEAVSTTPLPFRNPDERLPPTLGDKLQALLSHAPEFVRWVEHEVERHHRLERWRKKDEPYAGQPISRLLAAIRTARDEHAAIAVLRHAIITPWPEADWTSFVRMIRSAPEDVAYDLLVLILDMIPEDKVVGLVQR